MNEEWFPRLDELKSDSLLLKEEKLITLDELEELCQIFPNEIQPKTEIEKETSRMRVKEILTRAWKKWRRRR